MQSGFDAGGLASSSGAGAASAAVAAAPVSGTPPSGKRKFDLNAMTQHMPKRGGDPQAIKVSRPDMCTVKLGRTTNMTTGITNQNYSWFFNPVKGTNDDIKAELEQISLGASVSKCSDSSLSFCMRQRARARARCS